MSRLRRKTFLVQVQSPFAAAHERRFLGYSEAEARSFYERRGYEVISIQPRPRRTTRWKLDIDALAAAIDFFELKYPVYIRTQTSTRWNGVASMSAPWALKTNVKQVAEGSITFAPAAHEIIIDPFIAPEEAAGTIWHELAHAYQFERSIATLGDDPTWNDINTRLWADYNAEARIPYDARPREIEARGYESFAVEIAPAVAL